MTSTTDLELFEERAAIREFDGGQSREDAERDAAADVEAHRHACEVRDIVRSCWPDGDRVKARIEAVRKRRGDVSAGRLAEDCRVEWRRYRDEMGAQE